MSTLSTAIPAPASAPVAATATAAPLTADQKRVRHATPDLVKFLGLAAQLALLFVVFERLRVDEGGFLRVAAVSFAAFMVHYWTPFRFKELVWIGASLAGAAWLVGPAVAGLIVAIGLVFYGIIILPVAFKVRLSLILAVSAVLVYGRATLGFGLPWQLWPTLGAVFMFRLAIYVYDMRFAKAPPNLREFLVYFFPLPNFYFLLFPVIDFQTLRRTFYQRDIHAIAQQGIGWMVRGTMQLVLYRLIYQLKPTFTPVDVTSFWGLVSGMVLVYLLYLRVSGHFHVIVGLMHLFGYDLPETHRRYLLSSSLTDFWRRINIYWKDFMVKMVYFPVYFRLRKKGETLATVVATSAVFLVTWATHSYQWFWFRGDVLFTWPDSLFWGILGACVIVNVLLEQRARKRTPAVKMGPVRHALQVAATFSFIVVLWSLWNAPTVGEWLDTLTWWQAG